MADEMLVTIGQAVALLRGKGVDVGHPGLRAVAIDLARDGRIGLRADGGDARLWQFTASELDVIEGELWRKRAGWWRRSNVSRGFPAWVDDGEGDVHLLLLPRDRTLVGPDELIVGSDPEVIECYEWPTGTNTGRLVRTTERRDGLSVYRAHGYQSLR